MKNSTITMGELTTPVRDAYSEGYLAACDRHDLDAPDAGEINQWFDLSLASYTLSLLDLRDASPEVRQAAWSVRTSLMTDRDLKAILESLAETK